MKIYKRIKKLQKTSSGLTEINSKSSDKLKFAKENFETACKNIIKIKKDLESIQKSITKIKILKNQKLQSQTNLEKKEEVTIENKKTEEISNEKLENLDENNKNSEEEKEILKTNE